MKTKHFLTSKTVLGVAVLLLPTLKSLFGIEITATELTGLFTNIDLIVNTCLSAVGGILAVYGRIQANGGIHFKK